MEKTWFTGIFLSMLFVLSFIIAGCSGIINSNSKCSEGDNCVYYSGSRGIVMYLDNPPNMFYYRTSDIGEVDGNIVTIDVRVLNDGASDAYGAIFLTGFSADMFEITRVESTGDKVVAIGNNKGSCYFDVLNGWNFLISCLGTSFENVGGTSTINIEEVSKLFGWTVNLTGIQMSWNSDGLVNFEVGAANLGALSYGRSLMLIVTNLDLESLGGSEITMKGDNAEFPGGDLEYKTFKVQMTSTWPAGQDFFKIPYQIKSCYAYTTFVSPSICIDPDPFSDEKKVCDAQTYTWGGSQGAPVAVTSVEQTNTGKEIIIDMTIDNVGGGRVWDVGYLEGCSPYYPGQVKPSMLNKVYIGYAYLGTHALDCTNYYSVRLDPNTGEGRVICRYDMTAADEIGSGYQMPLKMELWYGYEETISQQLTIRKLN